MIASSIQVKDISLPAPTIPAAMPRFTSSDFGARIDKLRAAMESRGLDYIIVYGDVTAFANVYYLTGYDVKFEQTLLVVPQGRPPILMVGHEGLPYSNISPLEDLEKWLVPSFSLQGQPRRGSVDIEDVFTRAGLAHGHKVGIIGEKYYPEFSHSSQRIDAPAYMVDAVRAQVGTKNVANVTDIMTDPEHGLKHHLTAKEIAYMENSTRYVYAGVKHVLDNLRFGMSETEAAPLLTYTGVVPLSYPIIFGFEDYAFYGLTSPQPDSILQPGGFVHFGFGQWGGNIARGGLAAHGPEDLPEERKRVVEDLYIPYFQALARWYETIRVGMPAGDVYAAVQDFVENEAFGVTLNPGHLIHWDEWTHSPFYANSPTVLHSGMGVQCDIISFPGKPYFGVQVEDGIVLADDTLQQEIAGQFPDVAERIAARRRFMKEQLGIVVHDSVLSMSDMQAVLFPYLMNTQVALSIDRG